MRLCGVVGVVAASLRRCGLVGVIACAACGRFGFEARGDGRDGHGGDVGGGDDGPTEGLMSACATAIICDDFENATLDPAWKLDIGTGSITLDQTVFHRGAQSAHMQTSAVGASSITNQRSSLLRVATFPTSGRIYARVWFQFGTLQANPLNQILNFANGPGQGISTGTRNGFFVNNDYTSGLYMQSATQTVTTGPWICVQFEMPSGTSGATITTVGGTVVSDITLSKATVQPVPDHVYIGIEWVGTVMNFPATDTWVDDVLIDDKPTTCAE